MSLQDKVALITGASRGIGRASAMALAEEGARVAVGYLQDKDSALETAELTGGTAVNIDITNTEHVSSAFDEIERTLGNVDILVNNAGVTGDRLLIRMSEDDWNEVLETNLTGAFRCIKRALPTMLQARWGRIITIGSVVATLGNPGQTNYAAAKAGLVGLTKSLSREVARKGITANVVAPGFVETKITEGLSDAAQDALVKRTTMERPGRPEEIAQAVRFCANASYMTGQVIHVDGGI